MPNSIRSILMLPAICMLAAMGAEWLYRKLPQKAGIAAAALLAAGLCYEPYHSYFEIWAKSPNVAQTFNTAGYEIAEQINSSASAAPKYVVVVAPGQTGIPPSAQTVMFLTKSYTKRQQEERNIHYVGRESADQPEGVAFCQQVAGAVRAGDVFCLQLVPQNKVTF